MLNCRLILTFLKCAAFTQSSTVLFFFSSSLLTLSWLQPNHKRHNVCKAGVQTLCPLSESFRFSQVRTASLGGRLQASQWTRTHQSGSLVRERTKREWPSKNQRGSPQNLRELYTRGHNSLLAVFFVFASSSCDVSSAPCWRGGEVLISVYRSHRPQPRYPRYLTSKADVMIHKQVYVTWLSDVVD